MGKIPFLGRRVTSAGPATPERCFNENGGHCTFPNQTVYVSSFLSYLKILINYSEDEYKVTRL